MAKSSIPQLMSHIPETLCPGFKSILSVSKPLDTSFFSKDVEGINLYIDSYDKEGNLYREYLVGPKSLQKNPYYRVNSDGTLKQATYLTYDIPGQKSQYYKILMDGPRAGERQIVKIDKNGKSTVSSASWTVDDLNQSCKEAKNCYNETGGNVYMVVTENGKKYKKYTSGPLNGKVDEVVKDGDGKVTVKGVRQSNAAIYQQTVTAVRQRELENKAREGNLSEAQIKNINGYDTAGKYSGALCTLQQDAGANKAGQRIDCTQCPRGSYTEQNTKINMCIR